MDQDKLNEVLRQLTELDKTKSRVTSSYSAPEGVKKAAQDPQTQRLRHRESLMWLVIILSVSSFLFLAFIIGFQMWKRIDSPEYVGVSDTVINIMAVSVFAQVIAVVAAIARIIFKD